MILSLGSLGVVAALNWQPLALLIDTVVHWPNIAVGLSQLALIACAAGSCVMITTASSGHSATLTRRIALIQYGIAGVVAVISLVIFFRAGRQPEMSPSEYLRRDLGSSGTSWLLPLLYVFLALTLVAWAGLRYSNRSRRGRALFLFTVGMVLIVAASGFVLLRAAGRTEPVGVGAAATMLGCAMVIVAAGSLLPSVEDWFGAQHELRTIKPLLDELARRQPDVGIGVRPRGPLVFRVAERMSLISDALYLEATAADARRHETAGPRGSDQVAQQNWEIPSDRRCHPGIRRGPSPSGSTTPARMTTIRRSRGWRGSASRNHIQTGNGYWRLPSSTGIWTAQRRAAETRVSGNHRNGPHSRGFQRAENARRSLTNQSSRCSRRRSSSTFWTRSC